VNFTSFPFGFAFLSLTILNCADIVLSTIPAPSFLALPIGKSSATLPNLPFLLTSTS